MSADSFDCCHKAMEVDVSSFQVLSACAVPMEVDDQHPSGETTSSESTSSRTTSSRTTSNRTTSSRTTSSRTTSSRTTSSRTTSSVSSASSDVPIVKTKTVRFASTVKVGSYNTLAASCLGF